MKKQILAVLLCMIMVPCFAACGEEPAPEIEKISKADFVVGGEMGKNYEGGDVYTWMESMKEQFLDGRGFAFCWYDATEDDSEEGVIETARGIHLGNTKEDVLAAYGEGKIGDFDVDEDFCYDILSIEGPYGDSFSEYASAMRMQSRTFVRYYIDDDDLSPCISFYFDEDDEVAWVFFTMKTQ